jgi:hypothetical protein
MLRLAGEVIAICGAGAYVRASAEELEFPATSVACTEMEFGPCVSRTVQVKFEPEIAPGEPLHVTPEAPDKLSLTLPLSPIATVLKLMLDPFGGEATVTTGGVLSILTVTEVLALLPALSVAVPLIVWLETSPVIVCGDGQFAIPDVASVQVNVTVTSDLFHPALLGAGDTFAEIKGGLLSTPTISIVSVPPGWPRTCTEIVFEP